MKIGPGGRFFILTSDFFLSGHLSLLFYQAAPMEASPIDPIEGVRDYRIESSLGLVIVSSRRRVDSACAGSVGPARSAAAIRQSSNPSIRQSFNPRGGKASSRPPRR